MKNAVMTDAVRHRCPGRERGSILIFALTVLFFFSGMAVFLKTMLDSQVFIESRDAEYAVEADLLLFFRIRGLRNDIHRSFSENCDERYAGEKGCRRAQQHRQSCC